MACCHLCLNILALFAYASIDSIANLLIHHICLWQLLTTKYFSNVIACGYPLESYAKRIFIEHVFDNLLR